MLMRLWNKFLNLKAVKSLISWLKRIKLPGFQGLSLWYVMSFFFEGVSKGAIPMRAAAISFRLFLAFFPGIIILLSIIPLIPIEDFQVQLFDSIKSYFPGDTFSLIEDTLHDLINKKHNTLLSIGFILMIYYASDSINAILMGFNESYHIDEKTNPVLMRVMSLILFFVLGVIMILAVVMMIFSGALFKYLLDLGIIGDKGYLPLLNSVKWLVTVALVYSVFTALYNVGTGKRRRLKKLRFFNAGATFATSFFVLTSIVFAWFISNFAQYNSLYGSLGTLMVLLIWMNFNSMILLLGFDLNVSIRKAKKSLPVEPSPPPPPPMNRIRDMA
jgi:membrane protein